MKQVLIRLAVYAAMLLVAVVVSTGAALLALAEGTPVEQARLVALGVLIACAIVVAIVMEMVMERWVR